MIQHLCIKDLVLIRGGIDMKKRMFTIFIIAVCVILVVCVVFAVFVAKDIEKRYYIHKLETAIDENNVSEVKRVIEKYPGCINAPQKVWPKAWYILGEEMISYPIVQACCDDNVEIVELLIENGADVSCNNNGYTPLSFTYSGKRENWYAISLLLIENGADLNYVTCYSNGKSSIFRDIVKVRGGSALPGYVPESEEEVMAAFNYAIENCDHSKVEWGRVLRHSASYDRIEIVKFLLDEGYCDVNDPSMDMTALMFAARDSNAEMVKLLLAYGADKYAVDENGKTAYDLAKEFAEDRTILSLLE